MEKLFFEIDSEYFCVHLVKDRHFKGKISGKVYPIVIYCQDRNPPRDSWDYLSNQDGTPIKNTDGANCFFDFIFCWRGVWEGRIYFKQDEYWSEELSTMSKLWDAIEIKMKDRIKELTGMVNDTWATTSVKCDLCSHKWQAVHHIDSNKLECPNCTNMTIYN